MTIDEIRENPNILKTLFNSSYNFFIEKDLEYGCLIKCQHDKIVISEDGTFNGLSDISYNIVLNDSRFFSKNWFDDYKIDNNGNYNFYFKNNYSNPVKIMSDGGNFIEVEMYSDMIFDELQKNKEIRVLRRKK